MKYKLSEIVEVTMGQSPKSEYYNSEGVGIPFLQGNRTFGLKRPIFDTYTTLVTKEARAGDVIMSVRAPVGDLNITPVDMCLGRGVCSLRMKNGNQEFLYYMMRYYIPQLLNKESGTVFGSVNKNDINGLEVDIISDAKHQQRIARFLTMIDDKIELNIAINDNLLQQCATLYDEICSTAEIALMSDLVTVIETGSRPKGGAQTSGIPSIGAEKIERFGTYDYSGEKFISEEYFAKLKRGIISSGDVLLYKDGAYTGKSSMALDGFPHVKCAVNEHVFIIRTLNKKYQYFLYFTLQNDDIHKMIYGLACGKAAQPGLNQPELLSVSIKLPPEDVLEAFEEQVNPLMHQIALNALETKRLSDLRDAILPKLISGEIDVSSIELD